MASPSVVHSMDDPHANSRDEREAKPNHVILSIVLLFKLHVILTHAVGRPVVSCRAVPQHTMQYRARCVRSDTNLPILACIELLVTGWVHDLRFAERDG